MGAVVNAKGKIFRPTIPSDPAWRPKIRVSSSYCHGENVAADRWFYRWALAGGESARDITGRFAKAKDAKDLFHGRHRAEWLRLNDRLADKRTELVLKRHVALAKIERELRWTDGKLHIVR